MRIFLAVAAAAITSLSGDSDRATAMITIADGAHAGTFLVRNTNEPCEITKQKAPRPRHRFDVSVGEVTPNIDAKQLTLVRLIIPDADLRGPNHSFFASIDFGHVGQGTEYMAETRPGERAGGNGTVTLVTHGQDATVLLDIASANGVSYTGTIQCSGVSRY